MEECVGNIENMFKGKLTVELLNSSTKEVTDKVEVNNAVMDFNNLNWKQLQKITWFNECKDGSNGGYYPKLRSFFGNSSLILTTDSTTPLSSDAYINGTVLSATSKSSNSNLSQRTDNRARYVFEYGPTEANGTFQSICWADSTIITSGVTGLVVPAAKANTDLDFIKTIGYSSSSGTVHSDGFVYHNYVEGNAVTNTNYFAKTNIDTGIRTNLFATNYSINQTILVHGSYYIFYTPGSSSINFYVFNSSGNFLVRSGSIGSYTYSFTNTGTPTLFNVSTPSNYNYGGSNSLISDGKNLYAIPHIYYSYVYSSSYNPSVIRISGDTSVALDNFDIWKYVTLDSFSDLNTNSTERVSTYMNEGFIQILYKNLYPSQTERIISRRYTPALNNVGSSQNLVFNSGTSSISSSTDQFNFSSVWYASSILYINNAFGAGLTNGDILTIYSGSNYAEYIVGTPTLNGSRYSVPITYNGSNNAIAFTNGSTYSLQKSRWSTTINETITKNRTIVYFGGNNNLYTAPISNSSPYNNSNLLILRITSTINPYIVKSNIAGYDVMKVEFETGYSVNGLTYYPMMLTAGKVFNPDIVSTRALLPSPFTKTSDKTMRITYDINFE